MSAEQPIKIGDAAVGQKINISGEIYETVRYVRAGERADEMNEGRGKSYSAEPTNYARYLLRVVGGALLYHHPQRAYIKDAKNTPEDQR